MVRELALVVSGASGMVLASSFAKRALESGFFSALHLVITGPGCKVLSHELGSDWGTPPGFVRQLGLATEARCRLHSWKNSDLLAPVASGSHRLAGTVILPCSAGMVGAVAHGISRGLAQRVADVALKEGWPLLVGVRETPMSTVLLENLLRLSRAGAKIVPPLPAFYLKPDEATAGTSFVDHYCMRLMDLLGAPCDREDLRWRG